MSDPAPSEPKLVGAFRVELAPDPAHAVTTPPSVVIGDGPGLDRAVRVLPAAAAWTVESPGSAPSPVSEGQWFSAGPGWRGRVIAESKAPPPSTPHAAWTAPELEVTSTREGREHRQICAVPDAEGAEIIVGRDEDCHVRIEDAHVSRRHLRLFVRKGRVLAEDLRSRWGTTLNDRPLAAPSELSHGDHLVIGATSLRYLCYWELLTRPAQAPPGEGPRPGRESIRPFTSPSSPNLPSEHRPQPPRSRVRPVAAPPPPPSAWEQNLKIAALAVIALCFLAMIGMLLRG